MTFGRFALATARFYRRTHAAVAVGVAAAVAVLAGALLVGASVRGSLADLVTSRLGRTAVVIGAETPFTDALAERFSAKLSASPSAPLRAGPSTALRTGAPAAVPLLVLKGLVRHQPSGRRAADVMIYGVDARFFAFHGVTADAPDELNALVSPDLAAELGAARGDDLLVRVARPTDIPVDSLHGRRDDVGRSIRLSCRGALPREQMGEFSLTAGQGPVRAVFVALERLQRDLAIAGRANALLVSSEVIAGTDASRAETALKESVTAGDLGLKLETRPEEATVLVESSAGLLPDTVVQEIRSVAAKESLTATSVLTWLATRLIVRDRMVPYSIVTAIDPGAPPARMPPADIDAGQPGDRPIILTEWAARELAAAVGDPLELEYYRWTDDGRLATERAPFRIAGIMPMQGLAIDRRLAPDYPGITSSNSFADWDPPFPVDLKIVRPVDEEYWRQYKTAPKAFLRLDDGQRLWKTRYGQLTSVRLRAPASSPAGPPAADLEATLARVRTALERGIDPLRAGMTLVNARAQNLSASAGATDFGAYFSYFSFFLMVSALLLTALFFRLSIEQRLTQIGVLRATGFSRGAVRRIFLLEGGIVTAIGALAGAALAVAWTALMMYGLRTWWRGAVGTTLLRMHFDWQALVIGTAAAAVAALLSIVITIRHVSRETPRALLSGGRGELAVGRRSRSGRIAFACFAIAVLLSVASALALVPAAAGFFGAGTLVLVAGLAYFRHRLVRRSDAPGGKRGQTLLAFAVANAAWRPGRSLTAAGLVASAVFLLVSVDAFRKQGGSETGPGSGTGGFALMAESTLPVLHDLSTPAGRRDEGLDAAGGTLDGVEIVSLRLRPGDDASCLNLYQPKRPRVLGVPERLVSSGRFRFAASIASSDADRQNPWRLLDDANAEGIVPAIVDQTSLQYVLHAGVGDVITIDADTTRPARLRVVASLADSVLQGELLVSDRAFQRLFPEVAGYRTFLVAVTAASPERVTAIAKVLEEGLEPVGLDAQDTVRRLEAYHQVENTYLSTFQALGGLGLMLGIVGVVAIIARNVLERRRELALLGAAGFTGHALRRLVLGEHLALIAAGLGIGLVAALVSIAPLLAGRGLGLPVHALVWLVPVSLAGVVSVVLATRSVRRLPLVASLRSE